jgi:branched-chain amino acid transport system substrate-binding protein
VTLDVYLAQAAGRGFEVLETFPDQPPSDMTTVCNLIEHPNTDKQFVIDVKM